MTRAIAIADRWTRRDGRQAVTDGRHAEAISTAALAIVAEQDPDDAVRSYLRAERSWAWWNRTGDPQRGLDSPAAIGVKSDGP